MTGVRGACLVLFTCLAAFAPAARANPAPPPDWKNYGDTRRTGPFRSCGSGMGVGLAGIGVAWGLTWVGTRYAGRIAKTRQAEGRDGGNA